MKRITVTLTEDQARSLEKILRYDENWVQNNDYSKSDSGNAFWERIRRKIATELYKLGYLSYKIN